MNTDSKGVDDVLIVGGGDIGLLTGLCIEKLNPDIDISIVDDFEDDPPEVGKSTYQEIVDILHDFLEIPEDRFLWEVKPVWKGTVFFKDWCGCDPFHFPFDDLKKYPEPGTPDALEQFYHYYTEVYDDPEYQTVNELMVEQGKSPITFDARRPSGYGRYGSRAYHLDLNRFNSFLTTLCEERGITLIDDEVTSVATSGDDVEHVAGDGATYEADLYVDASGFNRVVKGEFDHDFRNFDLPLDSAYNAKVEQDLADAVPATVIESGDNGWFWQIDTYNFRDRGYVYASEFVSDDDAAAAFLEQCDDSVSEDDLTKYEFTSGYYKNTWRGNCVAIGNASGFVEPLQSTGLTANAKAATYLSHLLAAHGRTDYRGGRDLYNGRVTRMWESIYDFILVHYKYAAGDSEFWEVMQSLPVTPRVKRIREHFDECGYDTKLDPLKNPRDTDDPQVDLVVFPTISFYIPMRNMGVESAFYEENDIRVSDEVKEKMAESYASMEEKAKNLLTMEEFYRGVLSHANISQ
jgi:tryptophan halogenase